MEPSSFSNKDYDKLKQPKKLLRNDVILFFATHELRIWLGIMHGKNGFVTATKLGTTNNFFVAATKHFAAATKRFVDRTKHFVVTK